MIKMELNNSSNDDDYYKRWIETLKSREQKESALQNEALHIREKCTSAVIDLQDVVNPKKWLILEEIEKRYREAVTKLKSNTLPSDCSSLNVPECDNMTENELNEINDLIKKAEDCLKSEEVTCGNTDEIKS